MAWDIQIDAGLAGFEAAVKRIPKTLATETGKADKAMVGLQKSSTGAASSLRMVAVQMPDVATQLSSGTSAAQVFTQQGLQVAQSWMAAGGSLAGLLPILAPVGFAVGALGLVWWDLSKAEKEATERGKEAAAEATRMQTAFEGLEAAIKPVNDQWRIFTGQVDELGLKSEKTSATVAKGYAGQRAAIQDQITETQRLADAETARAEKIQAARQSMAGGGGAGGFDELWLSSSKATDAMSEATTAAGRYQAKIATLRKEQAALTTTQSEAEFRIRTMAQAERVDAENKAAEEEATRKQTEAERARSEALARQNEQLRERERLEKEALGRISESILMSGEREKREKETSDRVEAAMRKQSQEIADARNKADEERAKQAEKDAQLLMDQAERDREIRLSAVSSAGEAMGSFSDLAQTMADKGGAASQKWAMAAHGAALFQAVDLGALAALQAWGSAPFPFNVPALVAAGIGTGAAIATIEANAPKYHIGLSHAPDEHSAVLTSEERVLTGKGARTLGGDDAVARANRGEPPAPTREIVPVLGQREAGRLLTEQLLMRGSPLRDAIRQITGARAAGREF